jgi:hypothetical protein
LLVAGCWLLVSGADQGLAARISSVIRDAGALYQPATSNLQPATSNQQPATRYSTGAS